MRSSISRQMRPNAASLRSKDARGERCRGDEATRVRRWRCDTLDAHWSSSRNDGKQQRYFVAQGGGGTVLVGGVQVITPASPISSALLKKHVGDVVEFRGPRARDRRAALAKGTRFHGRVWDVRRDVVYRRATRSVQITRSARSRFFWARDETCYRTPVQYVLQAARSLGHATSIACAGGT